MPLASRSVGFARRLTLPTFSTLINDPFTGANGAAPSTLYWGTPAKSTGSTVDINTNQLRMAGGTLGGYADYQHLSSVSAAADFDFNIDVIIAVSTTEHFPQVGFRGSGVQESQVGEQTEQTTGYFVDFDVLGNLLILRRRTAGANVTLGSVTIDWADGDVAHLRIHPSGSSIKVGCTRNAAAAPTTDLITVTDATYATGKFWLGHAGGADTVADTVRFDNAVVTVPSPNVSGSLARTLGGLTLVASGTFGTGISFAQYKTMVLATRVGYALHGNVQGGSAASAVTEVTNTNDSGAGSLRAALTGGADRWITFRRDVFPRNTEITINLTSGPIQIPNPGRVTIDGRGAFLKFTGYGIVTANWTGVSPWVSNVANDLIFLNFRQASIASGNYDCITCDGTDRLWIWHYEAGDGGDGNIDITLTGYGPNPFGYMTLDYVYAHDTQSSKNCLFGDQTELAAVTPPTGYGDLASTTSSYPSFEGGDNRITIARSRFKDLQRNPIKFNYWSHEYNNYYHGYTLEGPTVMGGMAQQQLMYNVIDGASGGANAPKGEFAWTYDYNDNTREFKRMTELGNVYRNGATFLPSGDGRTNPSGSIFTIPYTYADMVTISEGATANALVTARTATSRSNTERAGTIDCDGYYDLVV